MSEHSLGSALEQARIRLEAVSDTARLDAELLLAQVLDCPRSRFYAAAEEPLPPAAADQFEQLLARRERGEPLAYITGMQPFWSLDLAVSPAVLIPRPESELLVEAGLALIEDTVGMRALDLGTGSGAVVLSLARERRTWECVGTDRSAAALEVARGNAARIGLKVEFRQGDWFAPVVGERFDLIVTNPPYVAAGDPHLQSLGHEPVEALVSGPEGLDDLRRIVAGARDHLLNAGWLLCEHGFSQAAAVREMMRDAGLREVHSRRDLAGHERISCGRMPQ